MRIESALYASRLGLQSHGEAISVIGDNIANSNTVAFKGSRTEFANLLETGNGVQVHRVREDSGTGVIEDTGRSLDTAIAGGGYFVVGDDTNQYYTRAGNFSMAPDGTLVTSGGKSVQGYVGESTTLSEINLYDANVSGTPTTAVSEFAGNLSAISTTQAAAPANPATFGALAQGSSFQSTLSVYDSLGTLHDITLAFTKTGTGGNSTTWVAQAYLDGSETGGTPGQPVQVGANVILTFDGTGMIPEANQAGALMTINAPYSNGAAAGNFTINLGQLTQFGSGSQITGVKQDGRGAGNVKDFRFDKDGSIFAILDSGAESLVAKVPIATFRNTDGLERVGENLYLATEDAGDVSLMEAGTGAAGEVQGAALERSTVDLAEEFTDLVLIQRGYQANSQTLSAANDLIKNTISLMG